MTDKSRNAILKRRAGGGTDLRKLTPQSCALSADDAAKIGIWTINATQAIGIATATEQGLSYDRYPIRMILREAPGDKYSSNVDTCIRYWPVTSLTFALLPFTRRPIENTTAVENLYSTFPDLDSELWQYYLTNRPLGISMKADAEATKLSDELFNFLNIQNPTPETAAACRVVFDKLKAMCTAKKVFMYIKVAPQQLMVVKPHGWTYSSKGKMAAQEATTCEIFLNVKVNYERILARYSEQNLETGVALCAAYAIAGMFRFGLMEAYESQEYYSVYVSPVEGATRSFTVTQIVTPGNAPAPEGIILGQSFDLADTKIDTSLLQIGPGLCVSAGLNHYMFNHTTGGSVASGAVLTTLAMFKFFEATDATLKKTAELVTSVFYEALHPVNKRAIANMFFKKSRVTTHGRLTNANRIEFMAPDSFLSIRMHPQPAGAHKAYVLAAALKRIIQGGLAIFLPWAHELNDCIAMCSSVLHGGAESHIGSAYYTGRHGLTQSSALDGYLPEVAYYMQSMATQDSLTMSPHLSDTVAARAGLSWQNLIKTLRGSDFSTMDKEKVKAFLQAQGKITLDFNLEDPEQWGKAADVTTTALAALKNAME